MAITSIQQIRSTIGEYTADRRTYMVSYRIQTDTDQTSPSAILNDPQVPKIHSTTYGYRAGFDLGAICTFVGVPRRDLNDKSPLIWILDAEYTFDVAFYPEYQPVEVVPFYISQSAPVQKALFKGWMLLDKQSIDFVPIDEVPEDSPLIPDKTVGPISNSALTPIIPAPEKRQSMLGYRVTWTTRSNLNFDRYINTTNSAAYRLYAYDKVETEHDPSPKQILFDRIFLPQTLLLADVQTQIIKVLGRNMYRVTLEFHASLLQHLHIEADRGLEKYSVPGRPDGRGGDIESRYMSQRNQPTTSRIEDVNGEPIRNPVPLDGAGNVQYDFKDQNSPASERDIRFIWLAWQTYASSNFQDLPIGITT